MMTVNTASNKQNEPEPAPVKNSFPAVWDLVYADILERDKKGEEKYGTRLQPFNGRKSLKDAYQEALDLAVYLRQALFEQDYENVKKDLDDYNKAKAVKSSAVGHEPDSLMCNCPVCRKIGSAVPPSSDECISIIGKEMRNKTFLATNWKLTVVPDEESIEMKYCVCPCADPLEVYFNSDGRICCYNCDKIVNENFNLAEKYCHPLDEYCACHGAVELYLAPDDVFRCRSCKKQPNPTRTGPVGLYKP